MVGAIHKEILKRCFYVQRTEISFEVTCPPLSDHCSVISGIEIIPIYLYTSEF